MMFLAICSTCQNLDEGLQGYYQFNNQFEDNSPNEIEGIGINVSPTIGLEEESNTAFSFNGSDSYINLGSNDRSITEKVSLSAWIRTFNNKRQFVVSKYNSDEGLGYFLGIEDGLAFIGGRDGSGQFTQVYGINSINDGVWHHIVGIVDKNIWQIWVDCSLENTTETTSNNVVLNCNDPLTIGNWFQGNGNGEYRVFEGVIDEVRIYNRALQEEDITSLCNIQLVNTDDRASIEKQYEIIIFPNPTDLAINFKIDTPIESEIIYNLLDLNKKVLKSGVIDGPLYLTKLSAGMYLIQLITDDKVIITKQIIKK